MRYEHVVRYVYGTPWAILPEKLAVILGILQFRVAGNALSASEIRASLGGPPSEAAQPYQVAQGNANKGGAVQVLPIYGTIAHRAGMMTESSGGTSTASVSKLLRQALADPAVGSIVLDVDSPGGVVDGVPELADEIYRARAAKPIVAVANTLAASAAYWLATQASELWVSPSGEVGSVGVYAAHDDYSQQMAQEGVTRTLITAGKYKIEANPWQPLGEEARAYIQQRIDAYYDMFVAAVARGRGVKAADVRGGFGEGRVVGAKPAVDQGMADRVGTLDDAIARAAQLGRKAASSSRADDPPRLRGDSELRLRLAGL